MIRVFLVILAVVAVILGVVLSHPLLYAVAGVLALATLGWTLTDRRRRFGRRPPPVKPPTPATASPDDELKALGILEIRPKTPTRTPTDAHRPAASAEAPPAASPAPSPAPAPAPSPASFPRVVDEAPTPTVPASAEAGASAEPATHRARVLRPCLQALRAALEAHTAVLLRQRGAAPDYTIEAVASTSPDARTESAVRTAEPLPADETAGVVLCNDGDPAFPADGLPYYHGRPLVRQFAALSVARDGAERYLLVVDTLRADGLATERQRQILTGFGTLLGTLLAPASGEAGPPPPEAEAGDTDAADAADAPRPRRAIIAEEMEAARSAGHALALGLIHLNDAETIAARGPDHVAAEEDALAARIAAVAPGSRVERFGELTYGVFFRGAITAFDAWAVQLRDGLTVHAAPDAPPVSIGIALLQDRHDTPEAFRADAMDALREAYETGTCTILE